MRLRGVFKKRFFYIPYRMLVAFFAILGIAAAVFTVFSALPKDYKHPTTGIVVIVLSLFLFIPLLLSFIDEEKRSALFVGIGFILFFGLPLTLFVFADVYMHTGIMDTNNDFAVVRDESTCMYFSVVTFTTLGYGDFCPTQEARGTAALEAIVGYIFWGIFIGTVLHLLRRRRP